MAAGIMSDDLLDVDYNDTKKESNPFSFSNFVEAKRSPMLTDESTHCAPSPINDNNSKSSGLSRLISDDEGEGDYPFSIKSCNATASRKPKKLQIIDDDTDTVSSKLLPSNNTQETNGNYNTSDEWGDISTQHDRTSVTPAENDNLQKIDELCKENTSLTEELAKMKEEFLEYRRTANKRVTSLQKELGKVRKKEAEEAQDLENAVRMVEDNLQKTTTRATKAETTVAKLREELKFLQDENVPKANYDALLLEHTRLVNTVHEKSSNVSQLMRTAADKTEPHIKFIPIINYVCSTLPKKNLLY